MPDAALSLVARAARGSFRDAVSTLDQLAAATGGEIDVQAVLQLLGAVEEEALFRLGDLVVDRDTAGCLTLIEELSEQGQDLGRLVTDLLEHLRHLLLVQHMGEVPDVAAGDRGDARAAARPGAPARRGDRDPADRPARGRGRGSAPGRRPAPPARARARQGDAARRGSLARVDSRSGSSSSSSGARRARPRRGHAAAPPSQPSRHGRRRPPPSRRRRVELEQLQEAWQRTILPAVEEPLDPDRGDAARGAPGRARRRHAHGRVPRRRPSFHRQPGRGARQRDAAPGGALRGHRPPARARVRGRRARARARPRRSGRAREDEFYELVKETFDAREVEEDR